MDEKEMYVVTLDTTSELMFLIRFKSYFVSVSYMCWAYRRQGITLQPTGEIAGWLY